MDAYEPEGFLDETDPECARLIECINTHLAVEFHWVQCEILGRRAWIVVSLMKLPERRVTLCV